jgi:hypothetical protein
MAAAQWRTSASPEGFEIPRCAVYCTSLRVLGDLHRSTEHVHANRTRSFGVFPHSLRRTKTSLIYRRTKNVRAVQLLPGRSQLESPVRYLGSQAHDALEMAQQTRCDLTGKRPHCTVAYRPEANVLI